MHLTFDIFQGLGIAAAAGIRPFLPALAAGALAAGNIQIDLKGTDYAFLQRAPFLFAVLAAALVFALMERRWPATAERRPAAVAMLLVGVGIGAVLFAGALSQDDRTTWPGLVGGALCALVGAAAAIPLLGRVRARLDAEAARTTWVLADVAAVVVAGLSILAPPVGPIALLALAWLAFSGFRRQPQKYAGLRILR